MAVTGQHQPKRLATVRVVSDEHPKGYLVINASDFDPDVHTKHESDPGEDGEVADAPDTSIRAGFLGPRGTDEESGVEFAHQRRVPTMRIKSPDTAKGFLIINAADFDPATHEAFDEVEARSGVDPARPIAQKLDGRAPMDIDIADLSSLSFPELRKTAKRMGVKAAGTRAEIELAILEFATDPANIALAAPPTPASNENLDLDGGDLNVSSDSSEGTDSHSDAAAE